MSRKPVEILTREFPDLRRRFGVRHLGLFGSHAREGATRDSDFDVLVELDEVTFDRYMDLKFHLEALLDGPVDLVLHHTLKPMLRDRVLAEVRKIA